MESLKELYRIGPGPSSSHTLAVRNACLYYLNLYPDYQKYKVELYGSLALTGKGHMTDKVIEREFGSERVTIDFINEMIGKQPNTMMFYCVEDDRLINEVTIYSTGGGAIAIQGQPSIVDQNVYPQKSMAEIVAFCNEKQMNLAQYVYYYEPDIKSHLTDVYHQMIAVVEHGLTQEGVLPGPLQLEKVSHTIYQRALESEDEKTKYDLTLTAYAYAAMEENASGNMVVTAPTLGSCGVMASLVGFFHQEGIADEKLIDGLAVAGVIGNLVKTNASISGAVGGCQAEVGTACAMAAALASYVQDLSTHQIEYAAEVAMEHNLGLTCDPVGGYVQVPCIERNGVAVLRALDCALYARYIGDFKKNRVSFDQIVETMNYTGKKLAMELRETSLGGLAVVLPVEGINSGNV